MSNNNNIANTLSGIFRSMSRRGQRETETDSTLQPADVEMASQDNLVQDLPTVSVAHSQEGNQSADESMPDLQDVSDDESDDNNAWNDDSDDDENGMDIAEPATLNFFAHGIIGNSDVALMPVVAGYSSFSPTHADGDAPVLESDPTPSSTRPQGTRRARVEAEDDVEGDSERDRRHPSQRASHSHTPLPSAATVQGGEHPQLPHPSHPQLTSGVPGVRTGAPGPPPLSPQSRNRRIRLEQLMAQMGYPPQFLPSQPANTIPQPNPNPQMGTTPESNGNTQPQGMRLGTFIENLLQAAGQGAATFSTTINGTPVQGAGNGANILGNLFAMEGGGLPIFGFRPVQEPEDPERAKTLVDGLEDVPPGLIRRLERVSPESGGCAICWEKLLEDDAEYLRREEEEKVKTATKEPECVNHNHEQVATAPAAPSPSSSSSKECPISRRVPKYPRIVTLPCSHLFHADCLIPWFTRPRQTTCPTCRFNIDPDNLTWNAGARQRAASAADGGTPAPEHDVRMDAMPGGTPHSDANGIPVALGDNAQTIPQGTSFGFISVVHNGAEGPSRVPAQRPPNFPAIPISGGVPAPQGTFFGPYTSGPVNMPENSAPFFRTASNRSTPPGGPGSRPSGAPHPASSTSAQSSSTPTPTVNSGTQAPNAPAGNASTTPSANSIPTLPPPLPQPQGHPQAGIPIQLTQEQLQAFSQSLFGRLFAGPGSPAQAPQPSGGHAAPAPTPTNNGPVPPAQPSAGIAIPLNFPLPPGNVHHDPGNGYMSIDFDFIVRTDSRADAPGPAGNANSSVNSSHTPGNLAHSLTGHGIPHGDAAYPPLPPEGFAMNLPINASNVPSGEENETLDIHLDINDFGSFAVPDEDYEEESSLPATYAPPSFNDTSGVGTTPSNDRPHQPVNTPHVLPNFASFRRSTSNRSGTAAPRSHQQPSAQRRAELSTNNAANPSPNPNRRAPDLLSSYLTSMLGAALPGAAGAGGPRAQTASRASRTRNRERRPWAPPPAPGMTLRQTIEKREREAGLRCWDVSCGVGPSDEDPWVVITETQKRQLRIRQAVASTSESAEDVKGKGKEKEKTDEQPEPQYVCAHMFHPPCIVSAQRAALNGAEEVAIGEGKSVEVSCPVCRATGVISREEWEDGVRALEADLD